MLKEVENKIQELHNQQKDEYYKQKDTDLENWGLTKRKKKKNQVSLIITDDEYEALVDASTGVRESGRNFTASLLNIVAVVVIALGLVIGIACAVIYDDMGTVYLSISVIASLLFALVFRGLAVAINQLQQIIDIKRCEDFKKLHDESRDPFPPKQPEVNHDFTNPPPVHYAYPTGTSSANTYPSGAPSAGAYSANTYPSGSYQGSSSMNDFDLPD